MTVALGSTLATILLDSSISLLEGMTAIGSLIIFQYVVTFLSVRSKKFSDFVKAEPSLLYVNGAFLEKTLKQERVSKLEVMQAVRNDGNGRMDDVQLSCWKRTQFVGHQWQVWRCDERSGSERGC